MVQQQELARAGESQAVVLVKALPQASGAYGETVCVAAITEYGRWLRLYPVTFRQLEQARQFGRWDRIRFKWRLPDRAKDRRVESRSVDPQSIEITGKLKDREKEGFLGNAIVSSTKREYEEGRSLALIRPENPVFSWKRRSQADLESPGSGALPGRMSCSRVSYQSRSMTRRRRIRPFDLLAVGAAQRL